MKLVRIGLIACSLVTTVCTFVGLAAEISDVPVKITSTSMDLDGASGTVVFGGDVHAQQGAFELRCDKLTAIYKQGTGDIETLDASGNVRFVDQGRTGSSKFANYAVGVSHLTLTGAATVRDGDNVLAGSKIEYSTRSQQLRITDARTVFYRDQMKQVAGDSK